MNLDKALEIIDSGEIFNCRWVSFNKRKKTGGKVKFYSQLKNSVPKQERNPQQAVLGNKVNHYDNATRTFYKCINNEPTATMVTIHIFLILEINGEKVIV